MKFLRSPCISPVALFLNVILTGQSAYGQKSFLSDTLVRKDQVQNVLEHQPAKVPSCKNAVVSIGLPSIYIAAAQRSD